MLCTNCKIKSFFSCVLGHTNFLDMNRCLLGGDQLTRKRLQDCKKLRLLSPDPVRRFIHIQPVIIELWHMKQDLLEVSAAWEMLATDVLQDGKRCNVSLKFHSSFVNLYFVKFGSLSVTCM